ncbi:hypothetical protein METHP14_290002 [Pseudomonas sp. P14-2025]
MGSHAQGKIHAARMIKTLLSYELNVNPHDPPGTSLFSHPAPRDALRVASSRSPLSAS